MLSDYLWFSDALTGREGHKICSPLYWTLRTSKCFKHPSRVFKAGWRSDDAIQSLGSFHLIAHPWLQIKSTECRKAQLCCITMVRLSRFSQQNCSSRFERYSLKHWTALLTLVFIFSLPLVSSKNRPHFFFSWIPKDTLLSDFFYWIYPSIGHEVSR